MRRLLRLLPLLLVAAGLNAQSAEWYLGKPIEDIVFEGLESVAPSELSGVVGPFIGETFTEPTFLELQRRLYALDYFEAIIPSAVRPPGGGEDSVILQFDVVERPVVDEVVFVGNSRLARNRLLEVVLMTEGDMVTRSRLRIDEEAIRSLYLEQGYPDVAVTSEFDEESGVVRFVVTEGEQIAVSAISFVGNTFASDSTLRGQIQLRERNLFNRGLFQALLLEQDRNRIRRYYNERGFVDAEVVEVEQVLSEEVDGGTRTLSLTFYIEEGEQYRYGGVDFVGNTIFSDEQLEELIRIEEGETLNLGRFDQDYQRVGDRYYENGYIFNQITREEIRDEESNTISFRVSIVERGRAHIENIIFRGNEKTEEFVLRRELPLEVGDVFSATRIREGLQNLFNLQYFTAITPETPAGSAEGLMDLIVNVEEGNTADISFGVAFGGNQEFPVSAQIQWQDRNFLGRGQTFGIRGTASPVQQLLSFNFVERWLFGQRWSGGVNLSFRRDVVGNIAQDILPPVYGDGETGVPDPFDRDRYVFTVSGTEYPAGSGITYSAGDYFPGVPTSTEISTLNLRPEYDPDTSTIPATNLMSYDQYAISLGANTGYTFQTPVGRLIPSTSFATGIENVVYDPALFRPANQADRTNLNQWQFRNVWRVGIALDNRDFIFSPSSGFRLDQDLSFIGGLFGGEYHLTQSESTAEAFFTLFDVPALDNWNFKMVLGIQSKLSLILPVFYLPPTDARYFSARTTDLLRQDGLFNARGWNFDNDGSALWNNWVELRVPLSEQIIWWDTFFEGALFRTFTDLSGTGYNSRERIADAQLSDWLFTIGTGIRFTIPQFPIRLYLAKRFTVDESGNIDWARGNLAGANSAPDAGLDLVFTIGIEFF